MKVLVTGFEPFGGESINPAQMIVEQLPRQITGAQIIKQIVPCVFGKAIECVQAVMAKEQPDLVVCIGQSGGRDSITPERVAINLCDARIPDNAGNQPIDAPIMADGENAYFSSLPIKAMVAAMAAEGIPAQVSNTAGTYVCNNLMYGVLYHIQKSFPAMRGGFVHVPFVPEQVADKPGKPALPLAQMVQGMTLAIGAAIANTQDIAAAMGAEH